MLTPFYRENICRNVCDDVWVWWNFFSKKSTAHFWSWGNNLGRVESLFEEMVKRRIVRKWGPLKKFNLRSKSGYGFAVLLSNFARTFLLQHFPAQLIMTGKN